MPKVCHTLKVTLFADDTCLHCSYDNKNIDCVQQDLTKFEKWLGENILTLNQQKTYLLTPSSPLLTNRANFSFNGVTIAYAQCVKYLGLHIDMNLTFKEHVKYVQKEIFWQHSTATIFQTVRKSETKAAFIQDLHTTCFPIWSSDLWLC